MAPDALSEQTGTPARRAADARMRAWRACFATANGLADGQTITVAPAATDSATGSMAYECPAAFASSARHRSSQITMPTFAPPQSITQARSPGVKCRGSSKTS